MDFNELLSEVDAMFADIASDNKITIKRGSKTVGSGFGIWAEQKAGYDSNAAMQTIVNTRVLLLSGSVKPPEDGDELVTKDGLFTVRSVETTRPTTTTLLYRVEVS